jgi:hypothetical protein
MSEQGKLEGSPAGDGISNVDSGSKELEAGVTALKEPAVDCQREAAASADAADGSCTSKNVGAELPAKSSHAYAAPDPVAVRLQYGNYHTVSGTDANVLRDVFNKNFRSSAMRSADTKSKRGAAGPGVRFISPNDNISEEGSSSSEQYRTRNDSKSLKDIFTRKRNKSGPASEAGAPVTSSSDVKPKGSTRVRTFFDSFRTRPRSISVSETPGSPAASSTMPRQSVPVVTATVGKKKKFKVTPASVGLSSKQRADQRRVSPEDFVEMFRCRTTSDTRTATLLRAQAIANMRKVGTGTCSLRLLSPAAVLQVTLRN